MNNTDSKYGVIIPAAGCSSRMGSYKPLLPLGHGSVLENQIELAKSAGISNPIVVAGFHAEELMSTAEKLGAQAVLNEHYNEGMFSSVVAGLKELDKSLSAFFLLPVDIPLVTGNIPLQLIKVFEKGRAKIVYPVFKGRRGHPPLISSSLIPEILEHDGQGGLRTVLERHDNESAEIDVNDEGILLDMDTSEAYEEVVRRWEQRQIPSVADCLQLLNEYNTPEAVRLHSVKVAELAATICRKLNKHGCSLSVMLAERAGLMHDIAKGVPNHATEGARLLNLRGYNDIARTCGQHMELEFKEGMSLTEAEVLYLADKLLDGTVVCSLEERKAVSLRIKGHRQEICDSIERRFASAERISVEVDKILGYKLFDELGD